MPPASHPSHHTSAAGSGGKQSHGIRDQLARLEELELALDAAVRVNRHLNSEVEAVLQRLQKAEAERDAWKQHAQHLARQLAQERRHSHANASTRDGADGSSRDADGSSRDASMADAEAVADAAHALGQLPERAVEGEPAPGVGFEWASMAASVQALVALGREGGWLARPAEVQLGEVLGQGAFGTTYRGTWRGADVAVKAVRVASETELNNFLREVEALSRIRHPHVVPFLGAVVDGPARCWLLAEYMPNGTLSQWLYRHRKASFGSAPALIERLTRVLEVARALAALQTSKPPVLHRDVKPSNIFIDGSGSARLGDFGLARVLPNNRGSLTGETGTYVYMSPEIIRHEVYDCKTDVWSFGVLLAEAISGQLPYETMYMTPVQVAMSVADEQLKPWLPSGGLPPGLLALAGACCDYDPAMRPDFDLIVSEMSEALEAMKAEQQANAASGGLLGRLMSNSLVPSSWTTVLGRVASMEGA